MAMTNVHMRMYVEISFHLSIPKITKKKFHFYSIYCSSIKKAVREKQSRKISFIHIRTMSVTICTLQVD